ncbi:MAG: toxic anion resistance protein [Anaerotardibacter sp.]
MTTDIDKLETIPTPTLSLEGLKEEAIQVQEATIIDAPKGDMVSLEDTLSDEERAQVDAFSQQIDVSNSQLVLQYGASTQKKIADFADTALDKVRTQDMDEVGDLITGVVLELKNFDAEDTGGLFGFFKRQTNKLAAMKTKYDKAENNINQIVKALEQHQVTLIKDAATLDKLYELNLSYFKEMTMYILAGKKRLEEIRTNELKDLRDKAIQSGRTEDAEAVQRLESSCERFEKKLADLDLARTISMQTAPQIRLVQNNELLMIEKIQTTITNAIPLWKGQMVLALGMANNEAALRAQTAVTDMTNELLRKNAEKLKQSTVEVAKASERSIVDIETVRATNESLIQTFDEVMRIQQEGREKRSAAELELRKIETELRDKLLEINTR